MLDECKSQQVTQPGTSDLCAAFFVWSTYMKMEQRMPPTAEVWFMAKAFGTSKALNTTVFPWGLYTFCPNLTFAGIGDSCFWHTVPWQMGVVVLTGLTATNIDATQDIPYRAIYIRSSTVLSCVYHVDYGVWVCCTVSCNHYFTLVFHNRNLD